MGTLRSVVNESPNTLITIIKFDGITCLTLLKFVLIHIQGRDKEKYLTGETKNPSKDDPKYIKWKTKCDGY